MSKDDKKRSAEDISQLDVMATYEEALVSEEMQGIKEELKDGRAKLKTALDLKTLHYNSGFVISVYGTTEQKLKKKKQLGQLDKFIAIQKSAVDRLEGQIEVSPYMDTFERVGDHLGLEK